VSRSGFQECFFSKWDERSTFGRTEDRIALTVGRVRVKLLAVGLTWLSLLLGLGACSRKLGSHARSKLPIFLQSVKSCPIQNQDFFNEFQR
jgi:hypothetical protein